MKKVLVLFVFLFSLGMTAQNSLTSKEDIKTEISKTEISKDDLPIGESFAMLILDGSPIVTGVIDRKLLYRLPIGRTFILSVKGKVTKYNLVPLPKRKYRN